MDLHRETPTPDVTKSAENMARMRAIHPLQWHAFRPSFLFRRFPDYHQECPT
jgi:hypothetical protein